MTTFSVRNADYNDLHNVSIATLGAIINQLNINNDNLYNNMRGNIEDSPERSKQIMEGLIEALKASKQNQ